MCRALHEKRLHAVKILAMFDELPQFRVCCHLVLEILEIFTKYGVLRKGPIELKLASFKTALSGAFLANCKPLQINKVTNKILE